VLDGELATFVAKKNADDDDDVDVEAKIEDNGSVQTLTDTAVSDGAKKIGGFEVKRANGKTEGRSLDDTEKEDLKAPKTGTPSVGVLSGPQGTRRLVPATPERPTVAPTRRPTNDKSKSTPRPAATAKPTTRSESTPRSLVTLVPLANDSRLPLPILTPSPTKRD